MKYLLFTALLTVTACAVTPKDAPQAAYEVTASYATALKAANAYAAMPRCSATVKPPCSDQATVNSIVDAANKAHIAVVASQTVAKDTKDTKATATDEQKAALAANDAVAALTKIIPTKTGT